MAKKRRKNLKTKTTGKKKAAKMAKRLSPRKTRRTAKKAATKTVRKSKKKAAARMPSLRKRAMIESELEEGLIETFPASDPVALTDPTTTIRE